MQRGLFSKDDWRRARPTDWRSCSQLQHGHRSGEGNRRRRGTPCKADLYFAAGGRPAFRVDLQDQRALSIPPFANDPREFSPLIPETLAIVLVQRESPIRTGIYPQCQKMPPAGRALRAPPQEATHRTERWRCEACRAITLSGIDPARPARHSAGCERSPPQAAASTAIPQDRPRSRQAPIFGKRAMQIASVAEHHTSHCRMQ